MLASVSGVFAAGAVASLSVRLLAYPVYFVLANAALSWVILDGRRRLARQATPTQGCRPRAGGRGRLARPAVPLL